ncbi:MAG: ribosome recycling factor [Oscillospiraceae bacterium]|nr:ribosome recycling factor [Oscillospiraceae bacterium]
MKLQTGEYEQKMKKTLDAFTKEFAAVRAGRANPAVLDKVTVNYYGTQTPINGVAEVKIPEPRVIMIQPWDVKTLKEIEKAILASDIGINPINDGKTIRLNFPQPTEERRKELCKQVMKMGEDGKIALRNIRREGIDKIKDLKKKSEMTEDEQKQSDKLMQDLVDKYIKLVDAAVAEKNKEIMQV